MKLALGEGLESLLGRVPNLVDLYEKNGKAFPELLKAWLREAEKLLTSSRKPQAAELAALRGVIVAAERGVHNSSVALPPRATKRKAAAAVGILSLDRAQQALQVVLGTIVEDVDEARMVLKQLLMVAAQRGLISQQWAGPGAVSSKIQGLWQTLAQDKETRPGTQRILLLLSFHDAQTLMEEILTEWSTDFSSCDQRTEAGRETGS